MPDSVIVTGGAGYIGSHVCRELSKSGYQPVTIDDLSTGHKHNVIWGPLIVSDVQEENVVQETIDKYSPVGVIHLAGSAYVGESMEKPFKYFESNFTNTSKLLKFVMESGVNKFVFSSSCATYGIPESLPIQESDKQNPINPYGWSKLLVEQMLRSLSQVSQFRYISLRYFNAAGCSEDLSIGEEHEPEPHVLPNAVRSAIRVETFEINGNDYDTRDGTAIRDFTHVEDLARAHVLSLEHLIAGKQSSEINLGTGVGVSIRELASSIERSGYGLKVREVERRVGDPPELVADPSKANEILGWRAQKSFDDIVKSEIAWRKKDFS